MAYNKGWLLATTFEFASAYTGFCALDFIFLTVNEIVKS